MKRFLGFLSVVLVSVMVLSACNQASPTQPDNDIKPNLTTATLVSSAPVVGSQIKRGDEVSVAIAMSWDVTAILSENIQPRLFGHRAGDPATMLAGVGMMFPRGDSYMELPPKGSMTLTFDGDVGGRAFYYAVPGSTIDYVVLSFMYGTSSGRLDFVSYNIDGKTDADSRPIYLNWNVK